MLRKFPPSGNPFKTMTLIAWAGCPSARCMCGICFRTSLAVSSGMQMDASQPRSHAADRVHVKANTSHAQIGVLSQNVFVQSLQFPFMPCFLWILNLYCMWLKLGNCSRYQAAHASWQHFRIGVPREARQQGQIGPVLGWLGTPLGMTNSTRHAADTKLYIIQACSADGVCTGNTAQWLTEGAA